MTKGTRGDYAEQWAHHEIGTLIISTRDYVVHLDTQGDLDWETTPEYDAAVGSNPEYNKHSHNAVINDAALLEASPCEGLPKPSRDDFLRHVGEALARSLAHDYAGAQKMLSAARRYLRARSEELSRKWYLSACFAATAPFLVVGLLLWTTRDWCKGWMGITAFWLALGSVAGAVGALFSVIGRTGRLRLDCSSGQKLHLIEGGSRIITGAISGVLVGLAVQSELILAPLARGEHHHTMMLLAAMVAGTGERLAKSIISNVNASAATDDAAQPRVETEVS